MQKRHVSLALLVVAVAFAGCFESTPSGAGEPGEKPTDEEEITGGGGGVPGPPEEGSGTGDRTPPSR